MRCVPHQFYSQTITKQITYASHSNRWIFLVFLVWFGYETCTGISYIPTHSILALSFHYERGSNCILKWNKNTKNSSSTNSNNNKIYLSIKHIIWCIYIKIPEKNCIHLNECIYFDGRKLIIHPVSWYWTTDGD